MAVYRRGSPEWDRVWAQLAEGLREHGVMTSSEKRAATVEDFMLMTVGVNGVAGFKHRETRNYVFVYPDGRMEIPRLSEPYMRGRF